jgi:hypothetical protein
MVSLTVLKGRQVTLDLRNSHGVNDLVLKDDTRGWDKGIDVHCGALFLRGSVSTFTTQRGPND